jgi:hypothetical protein
MCKNKLFVDFLFILCIYTFTYCWIKFSQEIKREFVVAQLVATCFGALAKLLAKSLYQLITAVRFSLSHSLSQTVDTPPPPPLRPIPAVWCLADTASIFLTLPSFGLSS